MTDTIRECGVLDALTSPTRSYQVTYRISGRSTATGDADARYAELVDRLWRLEGVEPGRFEDKAHTSTSA